MRLTFTGRGAFNRYAGRGVVFLDGETHEVSDETGAYLLADFADYFEPATGRSPRDRAVRDPGARLAALPAGQDPAVPYFSVLDSSIPVLREALATGEHDDHLPALLAAERGGKTRRGAVAAIEERIAEVGG